MRAGIHLSRLGEHVPRRGNRLTRAFGKTVVRLSGWRVDGEIPDREKFVVLVAPHTTGWDFPICIVTLMAIGVRVSWLGIDWMFRYPLMRNMGGIPVGQQTRLGVVSRAIEAFKTHPRYILGLSPEGSRQKVVPWKTGFYRIATGAEVPILMVAVDPRARHIAVGPAFDASGDYQADMDEHIRPVYARFADKYPDRFGI